MIANFPRATLILGGDLNCYLLKTGDTSNPLLRLCTTYGLHVSNRGRATYRPAGSLLDVIITNRPELIRRVGVTRCHYGGPHDFTRVLLGRESGAAPTRGSSVYRRAISRIDHDSFNQQLAETDRSPVFDCDTTERKLNVFHGAFIDQLNTVAPLKRVRDRQVTAPPVSA